MSRIPSACVGVVTALMALLPIGGCGGGNGGVVVVPTKVIAGGGKAVATFADGSFVVVGTFGSTTTFGAGEANETMLTSAGGQDVFVARFNADLTLAWARGAGGPTTFDQGFDVTTVPDGTCIATGRFGDAAVFGAGEPTQTTLMPATAGVLGTFVARFGINGNLIWAKGASGTDPMTPEAVSAFADGSSMVVGSLTGLATFGAGEAGETVVNVAGGFSDAFVARYNADGTLAWVRAPGDSGAATTAACGVGALPTGQSVVCGTFAGTAVFGPGAAGMVTSGGSRDSFVACYELDGTLGWVRRAGGASFAASEDVATFADGTSVVTGSFFGTATFGPGELGQTILTSTGSSEVFFARYNTDGSLAWAKQAGGSGDDEGLSIASFPDGSCVATGFFEEPSATFGPGEAGATTLSSLGLTDLFFARYLPNGVLAWVRQAGSTINDEESAIAAFSNGRSIATGDIIDPMTFGPGEPNEVVLTGTTFIARFAPTGNLE